MPKVFDYFIDKISEPITKENVTTKAAIYSHIFSQECNTKINPTLQFSKVQIEKVLELITALFLRDGYHKVAERCIYYCSNPLAKEWIIEKSNDKKWLKQFAHISAFRDPLDEELKDAFISALEFIEDEKLRTHLEFGDGDSKKYWEITFYRKAFIVGYGKIGGVGRMSEKQLDSVEECHKFGKELIDQKLKKGYVRIN